MRTGQSDHFRVVTPFGRGGYFRETPVHHRVGAKAIHRHPANEIEGFRGFERPRFVPHQPISFSSFMRKNASRIVREAKLLPKPCGDVPAMRVLLIA